jgi:putative ABC transport system permease protein
MLPVGLGLVTGVILATAASRALEGLIFGLRATDPLTYGIPAARLGLAALAATLLPARRALRADPTVALRGQ